MEPLPLPDSPGARGILFAGCKGLRAQSDAIGEPMAGAATIRTYHLEYAFSDTGAAATQ